MQWQQQATATATCRTEQRQCQCGLRMRMPPWERESTYLASLLLSSLECDLVVWAGLAGGVSWLGGVGSGTEARNAKERKKKKGYKIQVCEMCDMCVRCVRRVSVSVSGCPKHSVVAPRQWMGGMRCDTSLQLNGDIGGIRRSVPRMSGHSLITRNDTTPHGLTRQDRIGLDTTPQ